MSENINSLPEMKPFRRKLRNNMTAAEVALWVMIKYRQLVGERFLRQFSVGHYVSIFIVTNTNWLWSLMVQGILLKLVKHMMLNELNI